MDHDIEGHAAREHEAGPENAELIGDDIEHALGHSWFFDPQTIHVSVSAGCVTLTGSVRSQRERRMAAAAAWAHEGVIDVENRLVIA
jgi:osmotically-inducible protein OsmY